ncbi:MAG: ACP S-malonyltransferase [Coriobacteriia bacterium]
MTVRRSVFVCPGQGSQKPGMLADVPENDALERLTDAAEALSGLPLRELAASEDPAALADTRVAQPLLYLADWGWASTLIECDLIPDLIAGHSLGELAALAAADVFSVEAGLELVVERSRLMAACAQSTPGGMAAVLGMAAHEIAAAIDSIEDVWVANDNSPSQVVISGTHEALEAATELLGRAGARKVIPLKVAGPFHSPLMEPARAAFAQVLASTEFNDAQIPVVQNTMPIPASDAETIRRHLIGQITSPVRWTETMHALTADAETAIIECGPGRVLTGLAKGYEHVIAYPIDETQIEFIAEEVM